MRKRERVAALITDFLEEVYEEYMALQPDFAHDQWTDMALVARHVDGLEGTLDGLDVHEDDHSYEFEFARTWANFENLTIEQWVEKTLLEENSFVQMRSMMTLFWKQYIAQSSQADDTAEGYNQRVYELTLDAGQRLIDQIVQSKPVLANSLQTKLEEYAQGVKDELDDMDEELAEGD